MGRHRRSAAGRAVTGRATGVTQTYDEYDSTANGYAAPDARGYGDDYATAGGYATAGLYDSPGGIHERTGELYSTSDAYLFASDPAAHATTGYEPGGGPRGHRRRKKGATPVRTGLLGVSAAVAMGAVAVASGVLPGSDSYSIGGNGDKVQAADTPSDVETQGGTTGAAEDRAAPGTSRDLERAPSASPSASAPAKTTPEKTAEKPSAKPSTKAPTQSRTKAPKAPATKAPETTPSKEASTGTGSTAEAAVLSLVNDERAKAGCSPVTASSTLAALAQTFSEDMAARSFFDHTDPDGASPWDRAEKVGIANLGGENIARGQADAAAVMEAWMNSPGHRANILNCDFKTLGVGAHFGAGGPWWTQDFGY
ncbi:CAP domain-containing protein [Streptomyces fructofermentans]|uniref:Membrane protein n=1 Tax=Streptomyces fructofermentans TaxID=152141 RepID=A0A918KRC9_9ACTN|nr:CAP domain-containing protein [Streptomyces fructofermentans]GGX72952.1 membrane protein [Streptomyces fructofermentans]